MDIEDDDLETFPKVPPSKYRKTSSNGEWSQLDDFRKDMQKSQEKKLELMEKLMQKSPEKSSLDLFFNSISKTVEKFTVKDQAILKVKIQQIVTEKEIAYIDSDEKSADMLLPVDLNSSNMFKELINLDF